MSQPRIPPRPQEDWDHQVIDALSSLGAPRPRDDGDGPGAPAPSEQRPASNIVGIFAWHPALTKGFFTFNRHLFNSTLPARTRELAIVRVGWLRRAEYEWAQHVRIARALGISEEEVEAISEGPAAEVWDGPDSAILQAVDEVCRDRYVSDETWARLSGFLDRQQLMDLVFTIGAYDLLGMAMNTFGLEMDPDLEGFPAGTAGSP